MKKVFLIYKGVRFDADGGKLQHEFLDPNGKTVIFSRVRYIHIGFSYEATEDKGRYSISTRPVEKDTNEQPHPDADKWRDEALAAQQRARRLRARKSFEKNKKLLGDLDSLRAVVRTLKTYSAKHAFVEWLFDEMDREEREKENREMNARIQRMVKRASKGL